MKLFFVSLLAFFFYSPVCAGPEGVSTLQLELGPKHVTTEDYYCTYVDLPADEQYIVGYEPTINTEVAHHMLLFGCGEQSEQEKVWNCKMHSICEGKQSILYAWAKGAAGFKYPKGVGYKVGRRAKIRRLVMQIHFHDSPHTEKDAPRLKVKITTQSQPKVAGIYLLGGMSTLAPKKKSIAVSMACVFHGPNEIHPIGFRTHAHSLSPLIIGYVIAKSEAKWNLIGQHSPQEPQAFYPSNDVVIHKGDILAAQCYYDTSHKESEVYFGPDSGDEMCNFYIMYYMENNGKPLKNAECWDPAPHSLKFPDPSHFATPSTANTDHHSHASHDHESHEHETPPTISANGNKVVTLASDWPMNSLRTSKDIDNMLGLHLGQVTAVSVDGYDNVYMFHRGHHKWGFNSFNFDNIYTERSNGPIQEQPLLVSSPNGTLINQWGTNLFYLPHGLTIDSANIVWLSDVARHQIFKLPSLNRTTPLALGKSFQPGGDHYHFCKPTSIAIDVSRQRFYVADGYCNHRVMVYSYEGHFISQFESKVDQLTLNIPHSLALSRDGAELYVADRENYRIIKYNTTTGVGTVFVPPGGLDGAIYAISFSNRQGDWPLYAVNGSMADNKDCSGFTIDENGRILGKWMPGAKGFSKPHDIAVNNDGSALYVAEIGPNRVWKFNVNTLLLSSLQHSITPTTSQLAPSQVTNPSITCQPSNSSHVEPPPTCPRPPPPVTTIAIGATPCRSCTDKGSEATETTSSRQEMSLPVMGFVIVLVLTVILLALVTGLVLFVRYRKRSSHRPMFNVRRFYSRDPKKKLEGLLGKKGFTKVSTYDSETDEEITVFQKT